MIQRITYAIRDNDIVHISEVDGGIECRCVCPACKEILIAKKGNQKMHHFAHQSGADCELGYITSLHYAAKEILLKYKFFAIPDVVVEFSSNKKTLKINKTNIVAVEDVELVSSPESRIPDIVIESQGKKLYVFFSYSNKADYHYKKRFIEQKKSAVEIDISSWKTIIDKDDLIEILAENKHIKNWVYNAAVQSKIDSLFEYAKKLDVRRVGYGDYRVYECPLKKRFDENGTFADYKADCNYCKFCIGYAFWKCDISYCTCENLVSDLNDLDIGIEERREKYKDEYSIIVGNYKQ